MMNSKKVKAESGAELMARLHPRPRPNSIDPFIFGVDPSPSSLSPSGQLVEIYGPEGVGKTELVLHCAAKVCLPERRNDLELNGLEAKVIIIDTDYKFSILRLAVILEKSIKHAFSLKTKKGFRGGHCEHCDKDTNFCVLCSSGNRFGTKGNESHKDNLNNTSDCKTKSVGCSENLGRDSNKNYSCPDSKEIISDIMDKKQGTGYKSALSGSEDSFELTDSYLEEIINESLDRVLVLKVKNSQQLLASLLSLENTVTEDHLYSLLIIDSISAFYWSDRSADVDGSIRRKMAPLSDAISRLVSNFGLSCLATSSAFFSGNNQKFSNNKKGMVNDEGGKNSWMNSEYLGKSWMASRTKKIILSRKEPKKDGGVSNFVSVDGTSMKVKGDNVVHAICNVTGKNKCYVFQDDFMLAL